MVRRPGRPGAKADIDVFVELMGGAEGPANLSPSKAALQRGLHVVTANKALLAYHGVALAEIAEEKGALLNFEAAVAGGIPVIKALRESLTGNTISRVYGIMNGTCNYILTKMEKEGLSFEICLKEAQRLGYAEADPAFDIEGNDTAHKLSILTTLPSATRSPPTTSISKASPTSRSRTSAPPPTSAIASSCSALPSAPRPASSSACIRPWCRSIRSSRRSMASPMRWRSNPTFSANC
jgi:homoserine dehydrogenase